MKTVRLQTNDPRVIKNLCKNKTKEITEVITTETIVENQIKTKVKSEQIKIVSSCDKFFKELKKGNLNNLLSQEEKELLKSALELFNGKIIKITKNQQKYTSCGSETKKEVKTFSDFSKKDSVNHGTRKSKKPLHKISVPQDRKCVVCGNNQWEIQNPQSKTSTIQCQNCGQIELLIL